MDKKSTVDHTKVGHRQRMKRFFMESESESTPDEIMLEILLFAVYPRIDVKPIVKKILHNFKSIRMFSLADEKKIKEVFEGDKKFNEYGEKTIQNIALTAKLIREVSLKINKQKLYDKDSIIFNTWPEIILYLQQKFGHLQEEKFTVIFLDTQNKILDISSFGSGTVDEATVYDREIIRKGSACAAVNLILVHNHFSGNVQPSAADKDLTRRIIFTCRNAGLYVIDHIIVSTDNYFSFKENRLID